MSLKDFAGKRTLSFIFTLRQTPGCTVQACGIRDYKKEFSKVKTEVLAISPDAPERLAEFEEKQDLNFTLLSDPDHAIADKYGAWGQKSLWEKNTMEY